MKRKLSAILALSAMLCGCTEIENTLPALEYISQTLPVLTEEETTVSEETTLPPETEASVGSAEETHVTIEADTEWDPVFYANSLFYGDSICRALSVYSNLADPERVAAVGGAGARNLDDFTFLLNDIEYTVFTAAEAMKPDKAFLWFGMNDINMTGKEEYVKNINHLVEEIHSASPESVIIIIGITPTADYHKWKANPKIIEYNAATAAYAEATDYPVEFIDVSDVLSDENGYLLHECDGGDGLHLTKLALQRVLSKIYGAFGEIYKTEITVTEGSDGSESLTEGSDSSEGLTDIPPAVTDNSIPETEAFAETAVSEETPP